MRAFYICLILSMAVFAHRSHRTTSSPGSGTWHDASAPTDCALYPIMDVGMPMEEMDSMSSRQDYTQDSYFYDAGQFLADGGFYRAELNGPAYYFSFCAEHPQSQATITCGNADTAVCLAVGSSTPQSLGLFSEMEWKTKENPKEGMAITFANSKSTSQCTNGTSVTFILNCTSHFDPETNYTVTAVDSGACSHNVHINTLAGCPIYSVSQKPHPRVPVLLFIVLGSLAVVVVICSCCLMCYACCLSRRERCEKNSACTTSKKPAAASPRVPLAQPQRNLVPQPVQARPAPQPAVAPRPQPPVTPPPAAVAPMYPMMQQQPQQQQQQQQMFMPNNVAYPNLYTGGYVPLVPMMAQPQPMQPQQQFNTNPFMVPMADTRIASREAQMAEDERLARMLQAQYNNQV